MCLYTTEKFKCQCYGPRVKPENICQDAIGRGPDANRIIQFCAFTGDNSTPPDIMDFCCNKECCVQHILHQIHSASSRSISPSDARAIRDNRKRIPNYYPKDRYDERYWRPHVECQELRDQYARDRGVNELYYVVMGAPPPYTPYDENHAPTTEGQSDRGDRPRLDQFRAGRGRSRSPRSRRTPGRREGQGQ